MLFSGADLIRTSGQQTERFERLQAGDKVRPVAEGGNPTFDENTQEGLLRFARFVHKETKKKPAPNPYKGQRKGIPEAYIQQLQSADADHKIGGMLNLFI